MTLGCSPRVISKLVRFLSGGLVVRLEHVDAVLRSEGPEGDGEVARYQVDAHLFHDRAARAYYLPEQLPWGRRCRQG